MIIHQTSRSHRLGIPGMGSSDRLRAAFAKRLDDGYHWFRGVAPGGIEPLEVVVVGPGGTWVVSSSDERGRFHRRNGHWYRLNRSTDSWVPWDARPVMRARLAGHRLALYLERAGLAPAVKACLLPESGTELTWEPGEAPGIVVPADAERLAKEISRDELLTPAQVDRIVALLDPRQPLPQLAPSAPGG
jgi:hypothetical protein